MHCNVQTCIDYTWRKPEHGNKGTTIWSWSGGGLANMVGTDYLFSPWVRLENVFPGKPKTEYLFSTATIFFKKAKKKGLEWGLRGGGGGAGTWHFTCMFSITFCRLLAQNRVYLAAESFDLFFFSVCMYVLGSKRIVFERGGGLGILQHNFFKQNTYKMVPFYAIMIGTCKCTWILWHSKMIDCF